MKDLDVGIAITAHVIVKAFPAGSDALPLMILPE